uniref:Uncharacterized protein n=1 Tax=Arundo donax TaxID=35708 RepID=A0A0A9DRK9_ARUDO
MLAGTTTASSPMLAVSPVVPSMGSWPPLTRCLTECAVCGTSSLGLLWQYIACTDPEATIQHPATDRWFTRTVFAISSSSFSSSGLDYWAWRYIVVTTQSSVFT